MRRAEFIDCTQSEFVELSRCAISTRRSPSQRHACASIGAQVLCTATVAYDFEAETEIELSAGSGDIVDILSLQDLTGNSEWCLAQNHAGHRGFVPQSFVRM